MSLTANKMKSTEICGVFQNVDYPDASVLASGYFKRNVTIDGLIINTDLSNNLASKANLSLISNINNTSDANKPISTATQTALDLKANLSLISNINNTSDLSKPISTATQTALDLKANLSLISNINNTSDLSKPISTATQTALDLKANLTNISNINNTSDANKPVSVATQTALDLKANLTSISNINNTSDANKPVSVATQTALDLKQDILSSTNRLDASLIGTGIISNTEFNYLDGVTSSIQTQLNLKNTNISTSNRLDCSLVGTGVVSNTELNQLDGIYTGYNIQTQMNICQNGVCGAYLLDGNLDGVLPMYPIPCCLKKVSPANACDGILLMPHYKIICYAGVDYTGGIIDTFDNGSSVPILCELSSTNNMESCYLYFNNVLITVTRISYPTTPYTF